MERWLQIEDFPNYSVSDRGRIRNDKTGRLMSLARNPNGVLAVYLVREGYQHSRGVAKLVASHFLPHETEHYATPMHLDGDRENNHVENLMYRPRWYANMYHRQFEKFRAPYVNHPIIEMTTGQTYEHSWHAATTLGLLENEIAKSYHMFHGSNEIVYAMPSRYRFQILE